MKLPRSQKALVELLAKVQSEAYTRGQTNGALEERRKIGTDIKRLKDEANIRGLNAAGQLAQATAEAIQGVCRALYDGRGQ